MKLRLSKKKSIIITSIFFAILAGTGGYLLWRVNQQKTLSETFTEAGCVYNKVAGSDRSTGCRSATATGMSCNCGEGERGYDVGGILWCAQYTSTCTSDCGDNTCSSDETVTSCPKDCAKCGDKICSSTESLTSCPGDCAKCGDKVCTSPTETLANCPGDCGKCGDNVCSSNENSTSCASDCSCKAMTWGNKPSGSYKPEVKTLSPVTITNPNSTSTATTGIAIKLNGTALTQCGGTVGASCFSVSTNSAKQQLVTLTLFGGQSIIAEGTYALSVTLPGASDACVETTSFTVAADAVVVNEEVPDTGLLDGVMSKIYLGTGFVFLGIVTTQFSKFGYIFNIIGERNRVVLEEKKRKREEDKRNRFERRFK